MSATTPELEPEMGTIYLLHFERPYHHARHYLGWTTNLTTRLAAHTTGRGARLITVITTAGIRFTLARTWTGTRTRERQLTNHGGHTRHCPLCHTTPHPAKPREGNRHGNNH